MSDDSYPSDAVNVLTMQNGITFLTSLTSLVTRTQLDRSKTRRLQGRIRGMHKQLTQIVQLK